MTKFADRVYEVIRNIPAGKVTTYKIIAERLGCRAYRAVGQALRNNPNAPEVPCHRVVMIDGKIGGYMGNIDGEKVAKKIKLLESEGVKIVKGRVVDFEIILYQ